MLKIILATIGIPFLFVLYCVRDNSDSVPYLFSPDIVPRATYKISETLAGEIEKEIQRSWSEWKYTQIVKADDGYRVRGGVDEHSTVSEGQAYGMLFATFFNEQTTLDGLWSYAKKKLNKNGLMSWHIRSDGSIVDYTAATDADQDIAMALILACYKSDQHVYSKASKEKESLSQWKIVKHDYCKDAKGVIKALYEYTIAKPSNSVSKNTGFLKKYEVLPGDMWNWQEYQDGIINPSYFSPGYYKVFSDFLSQQGEHEHLQWIKVRDRSYELLNLLQSNSQNCSGLVPNWANLKGEPITRTGKAINDTYWGYDASRIVWRLSLDYAWYQEKRAENALKKIGNFFASLPEEKTFSEFKMNGEIVNAQYSSALFGSMALNSIIFTKSLKPVSCGEAKGSLLSTNEKRIRAVLSNKDKHPYTYYGNAWRLFSLLLTANKIQKH
jgi:endo-1,4-beta-D-glucanase Y